MNTELNNMAETISKSAVQSASSSRRRIDRIDEPARPLGTKRAALYVRRKHSAGQHNLSKASTGEIGVLTLATKDQTVAFSMRATSLGLLMERTQHQAVGTRLVQVMVFADQPAFDRWCAFEPLRFVDALLYSQLRREGHAALTAHR